MSPARPGPHPSLATVDVLDAIATRGRWWTAAFAREQISSVHEAVNREILQGNLVDACTLSSQGARVLAESGRPNDQVLIELHDDHRCREHSPCWRIECAHCRTLQLAHVTEDVLEDRVQQVIAGHLCLAAPHVSRGEPEHALG